MTDEEFRLKMKENGCSDEFINDILKIRDEEKKDGIIHPLEIHLLLGKKRISDFPLDPLE